MPNIGNYLTISAGTKHLWQSLIYHICQLEWFIYSIYKSVGLMLFDFKLITYCANIESKRKTNKAVSAYKIRKEVLIKLHSNTY